MEKQLKRGDIVRYHTPYPDEVGIQYIVLNAFYDMPKPRVEIQTLSTGLHFAPRYTSFAEELEMVWDARSLHLI
ncbi:hypothetical protein [Parapedobacter tibetensis]|uniref:hypothetical protein n=1 Tax=Parapedobacter tibetensis TaxID=2972951 RepID=UPI00214D8333|nr:hypothetical protein [Parapedobacter tibetensis]